MISGPAQQTNLESAGPSWHVLPESLRELAAQYPGAVLLETAKKDTDYDRSFLFLQPLRELIAHKPGELDGLLASVDQALAEGHFVAGYFAYECGEHFVGIHPSKDQTGLSKPLACFGVFSEPVTFEHRSGTVLGPLSELVQEAAGSVFGAALDTIEVSRLEISFEDYASRIARVHEYLRNGHTYQVNFTDRLVGRIEAEPLRIYKNLLRQQPVSFAAYVNRTEGAILSFSPEMFFRIADGRVTVRPMKGTWPRGLNQQADENASKLFLQDKKIHSEHVTIVDLLRNDVGRICKMGSVQIEKLLSVETYATLLQMTSTITGSLEEGTTSTEVLRHLFPCGSITGAPKRRTMEIICEIERHPRGVYTGGIGYFAPNGDACFNVAIRTMELQGSDFIFGVGGGIVADSRAEEEYKECRLKSNFLTKQRPGFSLLETMRCEDGQIALLGAHLSRLASSATYFDIHYDAVALQQELKEVASKCTNALCRIRMTLDENGCWEITASALEQSSWTGKVLLSNEHTNSKDVFLHHKTTHRSFYDEHLATARGNGWDEVLFLNEHGLLTEAAISNLFIRRDGKWLTPALSGGVLPGVQRAALLQQLSASECKIDLKDLQQADAMLLCNALRGARPVYEISDTDHKTIWACPASSAV